MHSTLRNKGKRSRMRPHPCTIKGKVFQGTSNRNVPTQDVRCLCQMKSEQNLLNTVNKKVCHLKLPSAYIKLSAVSESFPFTGVKATVAWG
jgi:hypothetical protein